MGIRELYGEGLTRVLPVNDVSVEDDGSVTIYVRENN